MESAYGSVGSFSEVERQVPAYQELVDALRRDHPTAKVETRDFPSGAASIDLRVGKVFISIQWAVNGEIGVSRVRDPDVGFAEHDDAFSSADQVLAHVKTLLGPSR